MVTILMMRSVTIYSKKDVKEEDATDFSIFKLMLM